MASAVFRLPAFQWANTVVHFSVDHFLQASYSSQTAAFQLIVG
jgi:hypothetical protein